MQLPLPAELNGQIVLRRAGYAEHFDRRSGLTSYVKRLTREFYPRFHVYIERGIINIHLDQKQASYEGSHAHSGEYDGPLLEAEIERIKTVIERERNGAQAPNEPERGGFFSKLFK